MLGAWSDRPHPFQAGTRWPLDGPTICAQVLQTGGPARIDDFADLPGTIADAARDAGIRACAGAPIIIDGEVWGAMSADSTDREPLPAHIEYRLAEFTELLAAAISTTASRERSSPGSRTSRPRCGVSRRWSPAGSPRRTCSRR